MREVYAIQHNKTKKIYIGASANAERRLNEHLSQLRRGKHINDALQKDYNEFGEDFSFYKLDEIPTDREKWREYYWMTIFNTYNPEQGYNTKDWSQIHIKISDFKPIEPYTPTKSIKKDLIEAFSSVSKYLGVSMEELLNLKLEQTN